MSELIPGHGRIDGHYFHTWCPYVRPSVTKTKTSQDKIRATTGAMLENNEKLLAVAWWVILNSPDLLNFVLL